MDTYLTPLEVAERLKLSRSTVYAMCARHGELAHAVVKVRGRVRVSATALAGHLAGCRPAALVPESNRNRKAKRPVRRVDAELELELDLEALKAQARELARRGSA